MYESLPRSLPDKVRQTFDLAVIQQSNASPRPIHRRSGFTVLCEKLNAIYDRTEASGTSDCKRDGALDYISQVARWDYVPEAQWTLAVRQAHPATEYSRINIKP